MIKKLVIFFFLLSFSFMSYGFSFSKTFNNIESFLSRHNVFSTSKEEKTSEALEGTDAHILVGSKKAQLKSWNTKNGGQVYFVKINELPILDVRVIFSAGSAYDGSKKGLAALTNNLLEDGAGELDADQIAEEFDRLGADFSADASQDMGVISLRCLTRQSVLDSAIKLMHQVLVNPTFPQKAFLREKSRTLKEIIAQKQAPSILATQYFYKKLYGDQVYASPVEGYENTVNKITREDAIKFYKKYYVERNSVIVIVGDISNDRAKQLVDTLFSGLPAGNKPTPLTPIKPKTQAINYHFDYPSTQSYLALGYLGITYNNPNYYAFVVGNYILGGDGLVSRLFDAVRSRNGLAYSVKSQFDIFQQQGPFYITLQTANSQIDEALNVANSVLNDFIVNGPTEEELSNAKKHITGSFLLKLDSNADIANALVISGFYHLPLDFYNTYCQKINEVTSDQIKKVFYDLVVNQKKVVVTVGG